MNLGSLLTISQSSTTISNLTYCDCGCQSPRQPLPSGISPLTLTFSCLNCHFEVEEWQLGRFRALWPGCCSKAAGYQSRWVRCWGFGRWSPLRGSRGGGRGRRGGGSCRSGSARYCGFVFEVEDGRRHLVHPLQPLYCSLRLAKPSPILDSSITNSHNRRPLESPCPNVAPSPTSQPSAPPPAPKPPPSHHSTPCSRRPLICLRALWSICLGYDILISPLILR